MSDHWFLSGQDPVAYDEREAAVDALVAMDDRRDEQAGRDWIHPAIAEFTVFEIAPELRRRIRDGHPGGCTTTCSPSCVCGGGW